MVHKSPNSLAILNLTSNVNIIIFDSGGKSESVPVGNRYAKEVSVLVSFRIDCHPSRSSYPFSWRHIQFHLECCKLHCAHCKPSML
ncbi:hypothetical protein BDR03DRAFT_561067 [Suillus americanus]|nr:hypothetical protein BDR03DRAFT_561067 [Suillus americanus]